MAQQHLDPTDPTAEVVTGDALAAYLRAQATEFLRALRLHRETGGNGAGALAHGGPPARAKSRVGEHASVGEGGAEESVDAARLLRRSARRISGSLHTFRPLLDPDWSEQMRPELAWLSGTLGLEHAYEARLERLLLALHRLSGAAVLPAQAVDVVAAGSRAGAAAPVPLKAAPSHSSGPAGATATAERGNLTVGAAKAGALLERQLTLARTRAHSTALQALGSSRFHAVADKVAVLASEVPLTPTAPTTDLRPLAAAAEERLTDAIATLPLVVAGHPYNAEALVHGLSPDPSPHPQDGPWHQVRLLLRLHRYAQETLHGGGGTSRLEPGREPAGTPVDVRLSAAGQALNRHRDASEAAAAAAQAARTPRIAPATAYALGVLHADQRHEVEAARFAFQQAWQKQTVSTP
ncbi:CHAD domain-containing protein [Streptomyces barringtoniae]|uniref:CHAD domain-containing protein n=1 Tax=Streptomyces barringtoniae TaxID=2892029 RepID=UPI001E53277D|nr:CHAD domain-containing protein [Streptomyces barringtoniae]MCC5481021.1 CHAD domain-containing protein [Streptomyces barringtoniae]